MLADVWCVIAVYRYLTHEAMEASGWAQIEAADRGACGIVEGGEEQKYEGGEGIYGWVAYQ